MLGQDELREDRHWRAALVAHHGNVNYGNHLVNYAARRILERCGCEVDVIVFTGGRLSLMLRSLWRGPLRLVRLCTERTLVSKMMGRLRRPAAAPRSDPQASQREAVRQHHFEEFGSQHLAPLLVPVWSRRRLGHRYDRFVVGSDQIWNYDHALGPWSFLDFVSADKKACLAPSIGHATIPLEWRGFYRKWLRRFGEITVREELWAQGLAEITGGAPATLLPDPTLMLSAAEWDKVAAGRTYCEPYLLVYELGRLPDSAALFAENLATQEGLSILRLSASAHSDSWGSGPAEFLAMVRDASAVLTDSYHGSIFAFIFDRPLLLVPRSGAATGMNTRIESLARSLHLEDRLVDRQSLTSALHHDYSSGRDALSQFQGATWSYLTRRGYKAPNEAGQPG